MNMLTCLCSAQRWQERDDWSYSDDMDSTPTPTARQIDYADEKTPDSIDSIRLEITVKRDRWRQRQARMQATKTEMEWNDGLLCWTERRDAWTGARPIKHSLHANGLVSAGTRPSSSSKDGGSSTLNEDSEWEDTEIPIVDPILPAENPIRSQISHAAYNTIYDKVVNQGLTPSVPINLKDVVGSCVQGWKRDGSWENKQPSSPGSIRRRTGTFSSILGFKTDIPPSHAPVTQRDEGSQTGSLRRGYQKLFKRNR
ncbi:hypothetical protein BJ878DRAFT_512089 [Calycina marina]|uniref:Gag1-like clamp domain-containing protein n=1 Tax=Calycina marina TaxID=1763456 RepID=A0A9P7Z149_9HELO|nr:hypothetical protein BJ878DRAFT_512089 [Calycina marina]